jgi:CheY-like chemotaxis protein
MISLWGVSSRFVLLESVAKDLWPYLSNPKPSGGRAMKNILVAEDDLNFGIVLQNELRDEKYSVDLVRDGVEAVLSFISKFYNLILMDIRMPRLNGIDALRIIKKIKPDIPAILFSGEAEAQEMEKSIKAGAIKLLAKPFEIAPLLKDIKNILEE